MLWLGVWIAVFAIALCAIATSAGRLVFERRVAAEARALIASQSPSALVDRSQLHRLPDSVQRHVASALRGRERAVRTAHMRHAGTFRTSLDGSWAPIRGEQHFGTDPPGFVWRGRLRAAPGLWIDARDRFADGKGSMLVKLMSTVTLADSRGPELDQGALLRLLGELPWLPTALLDERFVHWTAIDEHSARATLRVAGREVNGVFEFGADGLARRFSCERYRDLGGGRSQLTPFSGTFADYREVSGMLVPQRVEAAWFVDGEWRPYARFELERIEYDVR